MKKVILGLALATMIISCKKETKVEETTTEPMGTEMPAPEMDTTMHQVDTVKTKTTVDTSMTGTIEKNTKVEVKKK